MSDVIAERGILDTSTVILLGRLNEADLPAEPLITAVTLAELSVGPLVAVDESERAPGRLNCNKPSRTLSRCPSTPMPLARLGD
jgi:hypothetical protein